MNEAILHSGERVRVVYRAAEEQPVYVVEPVAGETLGTIVFVHGLCEHAFRFFPFARDMATRGYRVVLFHLAGHGMKPEAAEEAHWLADSYLSGEAAAVHARIAKCDADGLQRLAEMRVWNFGRLTETRMADHGRQIAAVVAGLDREAGKSGPQKLFLAGHSLGGLLAAEAAWQLGQNGPLQPSGVMLFSPAFRPISPPDGGAIGRGVVDSTWRTIRYWGWSPNAWLVRKMMGANFRVETAWAHRYVSDIAAHQDLHRVDPLNLRRIPSGYLSAIQDQMAVTLDRPLSYPCDAILFAGADDPVVNPKGIIKFARKLQKARGEARNPLVLYENFYAHSPLHSTKRDDVMRKLDRWLAEHT